MNKFIILLSLWASLLNASEMLPWNVRLQTETTKILKKYDAEIGLFVKDIQTGVTYSLNADTPWYLASAVKVFVAIETFKQIHEGIITLDQEFVLTKNDYRDGAGQINWHEPGSKVTTKFLLEQMLFESDNAATDKLMSIVGLDKINTTARLVAPGIAPITTILSVRKTVFGLIHEKTSQLTNMNFMELKKIKSDKKIMKRLSQMINVPISEFKYKSVEQAYEAFYAQEFNSATLRDYALALEELQNPTKLPPEAASQVLEFMGQCKTGGNRIKAGLPKGTKWVHKTGTRPRRICDMGIINDRFVVTSCIKSFKTVKGANKAMESLGRAIGLTVLESHKRSVSQEDPFFSNN